MQVDEIIYNAITADAALMTAIGGRVKSTCFEVAPGDEDKTPIPNIIITDDGFQNQVGTKDTVWESDKDRVQVTVDIAAASPNEVKQLVKAVRRAIKQYVILTYQDGNDTPELESLTSEGIAWDWMKPCYYQRLTYQCITVANIEDEQEGN